MRKNYQNREIDTNQPTVSETVSVTLDELAADMREGLLALAVGAGLQVMAAIMEQDLTAVCGPKGRHDPQRTATRHGHERGSVTLGGRRVAVTRPRMRAVDGSGGLPVAAYESCSAVMGSSVASSPRDADGCVAAQGDLVHDPTGVAVLAVRVVRSRAVVPTSPGRQRCRTMCSGRVRCA